VANQCLACKHLELSLKVVFEPDSNKLKCNLRTHIQLAFVHCNRRGVSVDAALVVEDIAVEQFVVVEELALWLVWHAPLASS
jgi:hypothetical protein